MAHNLNYNEKTGNHSFFSVQEKPWHSLGKIVTDYPPSAEALQFAGLDYTVQKRELFTHSSSETDTPEPTQEKIKVPDYYATVRADNNAVLGVVGKDYKVVQNVDAFSFFDEIVGGGEGILYETAGALGKGERIFITAKLPSYIKVDNDDLIENYVFLTTSHDGSGSIIAAFTPVRIVCNNTLNAALRNCSNVIKIRHTANAIERLKEAHKVMGMVNTLTPTIESIFNQFSKIRISDPQVMELIRRAMCPNKEVLAKLEFGKLDETSTIFQNMCNQVYEYAMTSETQQLETTKGTLFGAYNAVTGYFQNVRNYKDADTKMNSILCGGIAQMRRQAAFNICLFFLKNNSFKN
ncbi:DUF932 domain-containing protein [Danxiaibacter flavus]|uniref:DUF932 domain-containing protein n=1 Tax=Danxiaibacter flavus TaxID=3049108 RepID=A0ABV3ZJI7_9BACT|nr:DUF932 domain-containing protein [Chitinophagaceae bacterium DXS]